MDQDISTNIWMLASLVSFSSVSREADQHLAAVLSKKEHLQFPNNCKRCIVIDIEEADEQRCSDSDSKTCGRRVVDLQPIQNGFLHFSSVCFSLRFF